MIKINSGNLLQVVPDNPYRGHSQWPFGLHVPPFQQVRDPPARQPINVSHFFPRYPIFHTQIPFDKHVAPFAQAHEPPTLQPKYVSQFSPVYSVKHTHLLFKPQMPLFLHECIPPA